MVSSLTIEAWSLSGLAFPDYPRREAPVRVVPLGGVPRAH